MLSLSFEPAGDAGAQTVSVNQVAQQQLCTQVAGRAPTAKARAIAERAVFQRSLFERTNKGKILRAKETSNTVIDDVKPDDNGGIAVGTALAWQKVFNYYVYAGVDGNLTFAYGPDGKGGAAMSSAQELRKIVDSKLPPSAENRAARMILMAPVEQMFASKLPWSAAFVSSVVSTEIPASQFTRGIGHWVYIRSAVLAGATGDSNYAYVGCDPSWVKPRAGDIICNHRGDGKKSWTEVIANSEANSLPKRRGADGYIAHCDIVTETHYEAVPPDVVAIGGNVGDTVSPTTYTFDSAGHIQGPERHGTREPLIALLLLRE